jgi:alanine racemase
MPPNEAVDSEPGTGAELTIDLGAIVANYNRLRRELGTVPCAAVVKADAYGLGAARVALALAATGCDTFWVAHLEEGIALRRVLPRARVFVLIGPRNDSATAYVHHGLIPTLNAPDEIDAWATHGAGKTAALHIDTGMSRLGLSPRDVDWLGDRADKLDRIPLA